MLYKTDAYDRQGMNFYIRYHDTNLNQKIRIACDSNAVFGISTSQYPLVVKLEKPPPEYKTLYAVTGTSIPASLLRERYGRVRMKDQGSK